MKFLYVMLSSIWVIYSWVCFDALQWKPPLIMPPHVEEILQHRSLDDIEISIQQAKLHLDSSGLLEVEKAEALRELATSYWLKAFFQESRKTQFVYLKLSAKELKYVLEIAPEWHQVNGWIADVYHIMGEYEIADAYYTEARKYFPRNRFFQMRHREMKHKWRAETQEE